MSCRARRQADARPWLQQRDEGDDIEALIEQAADQDEHLRARAWEQYEAEQQGVQG